MSLEDHTEQKVHFEMNTGLDYINAITTWMSVGGKIMSGHHWKLLAQLCFSVTSSFLNRSHFIRK